MRALLCLVPMLLFACGRPCDGPAACDDDQICFHDRCAAAFGREYTFVMVGAEVGQFKPNGDPWAGDGQPDLYAVFGFVAQPPPCQTDPVVDSRNPEWLGACSWRLLSGDQFGAELWDAGPEPDELIAAWIWPDDSDLVELARERNEALLIDDTTGSIQLAYAVEVTP